VDLAPFRFVDLKCAIDGKLHMEAAVGVDVGEFAAAADHVRTRKVEIISER